MPPIFVPVGIPLPYQGGSGRIGQDLVVKEHSVFGKDEYLLMNRTYGTTNHGMSLGPRKYATHPRILKQGLLVRKSFFATHDVDAINGGRSGNLKMTMITVQSKSRGASEI